MIRYLDRNYFNGTTAFHGSDWVSPPILPTQEVKQGDPLPCVLFEIVIGYLLRSLPRKCGLRFGGGVIKAMAFADEMNLIAETPQGFQALIDHSTAYILQCGMKINQAVPHVINCCLRQGKEDGSHCQADLYHRCSAYSSTLESRSLDLPRDHVYSREPVNTKFKVKACATAQEINESST